MIMHSVVCSHSETRFDVRSDGQFWRCLIKQSKMCPCSPCSVNNCRICLSDRSQYAVPLAVSKCDFYVKIAEKFTIFNVKIADKNWDFFSSFHGNARGRPRGRIYTCPKATPRKAGPRGRLFLEEKERYEKMMKRTKLCEERKKPYTPREMSLFVVYSYRVSFGNDHQ